VPLHTPRGPFYSPKVARSRWRLGAPFGMPLLPSVRWRTGLSGAHRTVNRTSTGHDKESSDWLVSASGGTGLSSAPVDCWPALTWPLAVVQLEHRTVQCYARTVQLILADVC
jgi:hypothetical protein